MATAFLRLLHSVSFFTKCTNLGVCRDKQFTSRLNFRFRRPPDIITVAYLRKMHSSFIWKQIITCLIFTARKRGLGQDNVRLPV